MRLRMEPQEGIGPPTSRSPVSAEGVMTTERSATELPRLEPRSPLRSVPWRLNMFRGIEVYHARPRPWPGLGAGAAQLRRSI